MRKLTQSFGIIGAATLLVASAAALTTWAADQGTQQSTSKEALSNGAVNHGGVSAGAAARVVGSTAATPVSGVKDLTTSGATLGGTGANTQSQLPGEPQVPEESATIRDDPTIAPDSKQSADNNVSFPNDI